MAAFTPPKDAKAQEAQMLTTLLRDLQVDSGDVVLFNRRCSSMSLYGGSLCVCAKFLGNTQWDHNGVVIKDPATHELFLLEATLSGVKMRPLVERIQRSQSMDVAIRKLQVHRTAEFTAKAMAFANLVINSPYEDRPQRLLNASVRVPQRMEREHLFSQLVQLKQQRVQLDHDLKHRANMPLFERNALQHEREQLEDQYHAIVTQLSQTERSWFENQLLQHPLDDGGQMFCSQLVAACYQYLGLLLPYPSANSYLPKHFSLDDTSYLKLQQDAQFLPREISVRRELRENFRKYRQRQADASDRAPSTAEELQQLVTCLRRHPLFHSLTESELMAIAKQFRRHVVDPGHVVFYQGMDGDSFYIIERGECEVLVDYDHLQQTLHEVPVAQSDKPSPPVLQRRKTVALPDFQSSSSLIGRNERVLVATNGPGTAFGDSALIYDTPRRATVRAAPSSNEIVLWHLEKPAFRRTVEAHPASACSLEEYHFLMETISDHPLFAALDQRAKAVAVRKCFPLRVRAGQSIINQGDLGDYFYVIEHGKCEIARTKPSESTNQPSPPLVDRIIGHGATFGEAALLYNSRRGASVKALEDTKVWCMDRATFLTITRSGSAALHKLFRKISTKIIHDEAFVTRSDLVRILDRAKQKHVATSQHERLHRAMALALALLFHDASGLVNFSQFAHFHIALGQPHDDPNDQMVDPLLPEAAFRLLTQSNDGKSTMTLKELPYRLSLATQSINTIPETAVVREYFQKRFGLRTANPDQTITYDDVVHAFTTNHSGEDDAETSLSSDEQAAQQALDVFKAGLQRDLAALRTLWHTAELQLDGGVLSKEVQSNRQSLTFDANLKSGWISAIRHNPTAGDWGSYQLNDPMDPMDHNTGELPTSILSWSNVTSLGAAIAAGAFARTVCAPLERLKILMQVPTPRGTSVNYPSLTRGLLTMAKTSGFRGLYSGNLAHCLWVVPSLPTKFVLCDVYRSQLNRLTTSDPRSSELRNVVAGGLAGLTANSLLYPLDVVRGRLSVQQYANADKKPYTGIRHCFQTMYRHEGLSAFYRGFGPASVGVFAYIGSNFAIYEWLRPVFILYDTESHSLGHPSVPGQILCATTASVTSQFLSYPFDLMRRRMQIEGTWHPSLVFPTYTSSLDCARQAMNQSTSSIRITALYRGVVVNCVKALPSVVLSFLSYEKIREMNEHA